MKQLMIIGVMIMSLCCSFNAQATFSTSGEQCFASPTIPAIANARIEWTVNGSYVTIRTTFSKTFVDNTYGTNAVGWPSGHTFSNLVGSDNLQLALYDNSGTKKLEFKLDYISAASGTPSGYDCLGVTGGEGQMILGSSSYIVSATTSLDQNLNTLGYALTTNSPATNSSYAPNATYPNWIYDVYYEVKVNLSAFGWSGFGYPRIASVHASPSKTGNNTEVVEPVTCPNPLQLLVNGNCTQDCTESIDLTVTSGNGPFTYLWSNGATTQDISGLCAGTYTVTVTRSNSTTLTASAVVTDAACPHGEQCFSSPTIPNIANARTEWTINPATNKVTIRTTFAKTFVDNTYGTNAIGWTNGHTFSNLVGSDHLQLALYDANGSKKLEFKQDYITASSSGPSGYDCLGVTGGEGQMIVGSASKILSATSSLDQNMNAYGYVLTTNSPATTSSYAANPSYPNWIYDVWYEVVVDMSAFGSAGFGYPDIVTVHASPSKSGNNSEPVIETGCPQPINLSATGVNCVQSCSGSIALTVNSLVAPVTFVWSNGATTKNISGLCAGTYTVTATASNNVTATASAQVKEANCSGGQQCFSSPTIPDIAHAKSAWTINGNVLTIRTTFSKTFVDNTYGTNAVGWSNGHSFSNLVGSDHIQLSLYDANGVKKLEFKQDYITASSSAPSGYKCLGVSGGEGQMILGSSSSILSATSSLDKNMNTYGYVLTTNSPATNSNYVPNATYPNWIYEVWYEVSINMSAFGSAGFGYPRIASVHASPSKTGNNTEVVNPDECPAECSGTLALIASVDPDQQCDTLPPPPDCNCSCLGGALKSLSVRYAGTSGATVKVYASSGQHDLLATFTNVQFGDILFVSGASLPGGKLYAKTYFRVNNHETKIYTDCKKNLKDKMCGPFKVVGFTDALNNTCDYVACNQCPCYKYFKQLTLMYNGAASANISVYEDASHQKLISSFNATQHGGLITIERNNKNLPKVIYITINGGAHLVFSSECNKVSVGSTYGAFTLVGFVDKKGRECSFTNPCDGDGGINVSVTGGVPPYTYEWSDGQSSEDISDLCSGPYTITVTDSLGCTATATYNVGAAPCAYAVLGDLVWHDLNANGQQDAGEPGIGGVVVKLYDADNDGLLQTKTTNANGYYLFDSLDVGNYYVIFNHSTAPSTLIPTLSEQGDDATDSDADAITGKTGIYALSPGDTVLTVDAGYRCSSVACSITGETTLCPGATSTYTGPAGVNGYLWTISGDGVIVGADNARTVTVEAKSNCGTFTLMLVSTLGNCSGNCEYTVSVGDQTPPTATVSSVPLSVECPAQPVFGTLTMNDNCDQNPTFVIEDDTTAGSCVNRYTITRTWHVTDVCGNSSTVTQSVTVTDNTAPVISGVGENGTVECPAIPEFSEPTALDACGSVTLTFEDDLIISPACSYEYSIKRTWTAKDACGNTSTAMQIITVQDKTAPVLSGVGAEATIQCPAQPQFTQPTADDACDGAIITHEDFRTNGSCANEYTVTRVWTATDACGNFSTASQVIHVIDTVAPVISGVAADKTIDCPEIPDFSSPVATDACGGTATLTFIDDVTFGECPYEFTIKRIWTATDACGNTSTASQTITAQDTTAPVIDGVAQDGLIQCPAQPEFSEPFIVDGCDFDATLSYVDDTLFDGAPETISFVRTWTAKDACGNLSATASETIIRMNTHLPATGINPKCHTSCDGSVTVTGDCYSYLWSTGATTATVNNLCAGVYTVTLTDDFGYQVFDTVVLVAPAPLALDTVLTHVTCVGAGDGAIDLSVIGGTAPYTYRWSNNYTSQDITGLFIGTYSVTVTDANGCKDTLVAIIRQPEPFVIGALTAMVTCSGGSDGSIDVSVDGATPPYTYLWSNGATTEDVSGLSAGTYTMTVTDAHSCSATLTEVVGEYFKITAQASITNVACHGEATGSISLSVAGGLQPYSFIWSNGATTKNISGLIAGSYSVTITDSLGCFIHKTEVVTEPALCDDNNLCTIDACVSGQCIYTPVVCDDQDACTTDACVNGACEFTPVICDDQDACTIDACISGSCEYTPVVCDDNDACTTDACVNGSCEYTPVVCDDNHACTTDACVNGSCEYTPVICNDNDACTTDACVNGACEYTAIICDDQDACTNDACVNGACQYKQFMSITGFTLVNATTFDDIRPITNGAVISRDEVCHFNIRAEICGDSLVESVRFIVNGNAFRIEEYVPFSLAGDNPQGEYHPWLVGPGTYTITAIPHDLPLGMGAAGDSMSITVTVVNGSAMACVCDDNNPCTINEVTATGQCAFPPVICDDQNACTIDACVNGSCEFTAVICDDNNACTIDACVNGSCEFTAVICDDNDACTTDACVNGSCEYTAVICDDNNACTTDACINGSCGYAAVICDDNDACTIDACVNGSCQYTAVICDDNDACTTDACVNGSCEFTAVICDDNNACTIDACVNGSCGFTAVICDDNDACTTDACVNGSCEYTAVICDDNDACTIDACVNGSCQYTAVVCDDNDACTTDACVNGSCEFTAVICDDNDACTTDACVNGSCEYTAVICDDNNACTTDACINGSCEYTAVICDDNDACTTDACVNGSCEYTSVICDDNDACTTDACVNGSCQYTAVICDDNDACTTDACVNGSCQYTAVICDDNDACTTDACVNGSCEYTAVICDDNNACTTDACVDGSCEYTAVICDDNDACTIDACVNGSCEYTAVICDDNDACTTDACVNGSCEYTAVICDDSDACTIDACVDGSCEFTPVICDDQNACTIDACENGECIFTPVTCDDQNGCTADACENGQCVFTPMTPVVTETDVTICFGDSIFAGGRFRTKPGTYTDTYNTGTGCDSTVITHLDVTRIELTHESTDVSDTCIAGQNQLCELNFSEFPHGTILTGEEYAAYGIHFHAVAYPNTWTNTPNISQLVVFNTFATGTWDQDLQVDIGNVAIFPENLTDANHDGLVDMPNDTRWGGQQIFTFDFARTILSVTIADHDRAGGSITAYDEFNNIIISVPIPMLNDGEVEVVELNVAGVRRLVVDDNDSGGLTDIVFDCQNICCDGTAEVFPSNGTAPYSFEWSNGETTAAVEGLCAGVYYVTVTDANGCSSIDTITINEPSEIEFMQVESEFENFEAYPSPFGEMFYFEYIAKEAGNASFRMYNTVGQVVYQDNFQAVEGSNKEVVHFNGLDGMYIIELHKNNYSEYIKVHKSH